MRKSILIVAALVIACNKSEPAPATSTQSAATTPPPAAQPAAAPAPAPATATTASVAPTAGAIASTDGEKPGMHIDITELKRGSGGTVSLKYTLTNGGSEGFDVYSSLGDRYDTDGVNLIDPVNKKKYFVIKDSENKCLCSRDIGGSIKAGDKRNLWAKFPAPPPEVTKVSIEIPHFQPMDDVPISQ